MPRHAWLYAVLSVFCPLAAQAEVVGVALDPKVSLVDGVSTIASAPGDDSAVFFALENGALRRIGAVDVPTSYLGAPSSVAVSRDGRLALVSASTRLDPADRSRYAEDDRLSVIDLAGPAPRVVQTLALGLSPSSVKMNPAGTMALVPSSPDNSITVLSIRDGRVMVVDKHRMAANMGPLAASFSPDGRHVLVTLADGQRVALYAVEHDRLRLPAIREMGAGITPFTPSYCGDGGLAVVANFGIPDAGNGDVDTVSLIDLSGAAPRIVDTVAVGPAPEDVACSPDGRYAVANVQNMSNRPARHPLYAPHGLAVLLKIEGKRLRRVDQTPIGAWGEGIAFADDARTVLAESIVDRALHVLRIEDDRLRPAGAPIVFERGAPVGIGIAGR